MIEKLVGWLDRWLQGIMDRIAEKRSKKLRQMIDELKAYEAMIEQKRIVKKPMPQVIEKSITELSAKDFSVCKHCGKKFYKHHYNQRFCSNECRDAYWKIHIDRSQYPSNSKEYKREYYLKNRDEILLKNKLRQLKKQKEKQYAKEGAITNQSSAETSSK